jgi:hypothetical protein
MVTAASLSGDRGHTGNVDHILMWVIARILNFSFDFVSATCPKIRLIGLREDRLKTNGTEPRSRQSSGLPS